MRRVVLPEIGTFEAWRDEARALLGAGVPPEEVLWNRGAAEADLFAEALPPVRGGAVTVPKGFVDLARLVVWPIQRNSCTPSSRVRMRSPGRRSSMGF